MGDAALSDSELDAVAGARLAAAKRLVEIRKERGMSQVDLAARVNQLAGRPRLAATRISDYERALYVPEREYRCLIAKALEVTPEAIWAALHNEEAA
jgi:transcriptional regulator with XRE-family HTH domain